MRALPLLLSIHHALGFSYDNLLPYIPFSLDKWLSKGNTIGPEKIPQLSNGLLTNTTAVLEMGAGWKAIAFGNVSTEAVPEYEFQLGDIGYVWITDSYCRGDSFYIFNNDQLIAETPDTIDDGCMTNATNPDDAVQNGSFGHVNLNFTAGQYRIKLVVKDSPFLAGKAFIRLDSTFQTPGWKPTPTETTSSEASLTSYYTGTDNGASSFSTDTPSDGWSLTESLSEIMTPELEHYNRYRCRISADGLNIFMKPMRIEKANYFCQHFGMELARIDNTNLIDALKLAWDCSSGDVGQRFWIGDYSSVNRPRRRRRGFWNLPDRQEVANERYQLAVGHERGRGSILKAKDRQEYLPFFCFHHPSKQAHFDL